VSVEAWSGLDKDFTKWNTFVGYDLCAHEFDHWVVIIAVND